MENIECLNSIGNPWGHQGGPYGKFQHDFVPFYKAQSLKRGTFFFFILKRRILIRHLFIEARELLSVLTLILSIVFLSNMIYKLPLVLPCLGGLELSQGSVYLLAIYHLSIHKFAQIIWSSFIFLAITLLSCDNKSFCYLNSPAF